MASDRAQVIVAAMKGAPLGPGGRQPPWTAAIQSSRAGQIRAAEDIIAMLSASPEQPVRASDLARSLRVFVDLVLDEHEAMERADPASGREPRP